MLKHVLLNSFERDFKKMKKRGLNMDKLRRVMEDIIEEKPLLANHRNHKLTGNYKGYWECHIEPDWLLIYRKDKSRVEFVATGTHSDLF